VQPVCVPPCGEVVVERESDCRGKIIGVVHRGLSPHSDNPVSQDLALAAPLAPLGPIRCVQDRKRVRSPKPRDNTAGELHEWRSPQCFANAPIQTVRNPLSLEKDAFFGFMRAIRGARNPRARILCVTFGFAKCAHEAIRLSIAKANAY
jgi:hypothetical protein